MGKLWNVFYRWCKATERVIAKPMVDDGVSLEAGWILAAISAGAKLLKKAKKKKAERAQTNEDIKVAQERLQKAKIAKQGLQVQHAQEGQTMSSSFGGKGIAGGPAASAQSGALQGQQGREMAEANINESAAQTSLNTQKKIKKSKKGILGWL